VGLPALWNACPMKREAGFIGVKPIPPGWQLPCQLPFASHLTIAPGFGINPFYNDILKSSMAHY